MSAPVTFLMFDAFGHGVGDNQYTLFTASFTLIRRTVTHSAGVGNFEGFHQ